MKFLHLADLHFGKLIHGVSLLENGDQPVWVDRFLALVRELQPDAVVIAGDVYDRSAPSGDAVALLDRMISTLAAMEIPVMIIAGNHDSGQRMSFGGSLLAKHGILHRQAPPGLTVQYAMFCGFNQIYHRLTRDNAPASGPGPYRRGSPGGGALRR